jgi:hypothetical protein
VRELAAEGIATSVLVPADSDEQALRSLLEEAAAAGAWDVEIEAAPLSWDSRRSTRTALLDTFRCLRLEYGFPRGVAGRG